MRAIFLLLSSMFILSLACLSTLPPPTIDVPRAIQATLTARASQEEPSMPLFTPTQPPPVVPTQTPSFTPTSTPGAGPGCIRPDAPFEIGLVTQVIDGDTISVLIGSQVYPVRYIGIDAPETRAPGESPEPKGEEATARNRALVEGQIVTLFKDVSETDRYDRLLRYVFVPDLAGVFVNYELVRSGCAEAVAYPPDVACND